MRNLITTLLLLMLMTGALAQVPAPSSNTGNDNSTMNWVIVRSYDEQGNVISETKSFFDKSGNALQTQNKVKYRKDGNTVYTHVFAIQPLLDAYGRPVATTLSAPIDNSQFIYKDKFVQNSGANAYDYRNFDKYKPNSSTAETDKTNSPDAVSTAAGTLGWYYSINNTWEPYTPTTAYPYSRQTIYSDGTGNTKKSGGIGETFRMGSTHESSSYVTPVINELNEYIAIRNKFFTSGELGELPTSMKFKALQTIGRDANGKEAATIQDKDGKNLMIARPGSELSVSNTATLQPPFIYFIYGNAVGTNAKNLAISGGSIRIYESTDGGLTYSSASYTGAASGYTSPSSLPNVYKIESDQAFTVSYDAAISGSPDQSVCKGCPAQVNGYSFHYFKLLASSTVTISGSGFLLYDMNTEQTVSFTSGSSLAAGYYKLMNTGGVPIDITYTNTYADVSYSFYNQLGQLVATIAPEGVKKLHGAGINNYATKNDVPFITLNEYDVRGRLVNSKDADKGKGEFIYRKDGKIRFSQNPVQAINGKYSYINYDQWGRPVESGEYDGNSMAFNSTAMNNIIENISAGGGLGSGTKTDVVFTIYDVTDNTHGQSGYTQDPFYLKGTVSVNRKYSSVSGNPPYSATNLVSATWYSYDEEGKAVWQIQYIAGLGYKTTDFVYDVMGRLTKKIYQKNISGEYFAHYYEYDPSTLKLWKTYTNTTNVDANKKHQATYIYYLHGPLKRLELAVDPSSGQGLQGIDYTYSLQGSLKAINNSDKTKDPNQDGIASGNTFLADAFGMVLDYFDGDYLNSRSGIQSIKGVNTSSITSGSYSGQIKAMTWFSKKPVPLSDAPFTYVFKYDDKYQFTESVWGNTLNFSNTPATFNQTTFNQEKIYVPNTSTPAYDANGNMRFLQRTDGSGNVSEKFTYNYWNTVTSSGNNTDYNTNKLQSVVNDNNGTPQTYATYTFDEMGQLTIENTGNSSTSKYIKYDVTGKVVAVARDINFTQRLAEFVYNESGRRIIKKNYNPSTNQLISTTYYAGGVVYTQTPGNTPVAEEYEINGGSGRLGVYYRTTDIYAYELTDHLGNIRAVVAKSGSTLDVRTYTDYYPYGMVIQRSGPAYRYGYQGKSAEDETGETGWNAFELRMYDSKIGRWLSIDPKNAGWSPYWSMNNDPVNLTDPDGGAPPTTYVDKSERVINVVNDGKTDVIQFGDIDFASWDSKNNSQLATRQGGKLIGHTDYWYAFMSLNEQTGELGKPLYGSNINNSLTFTRAALAEVFQHDELIAPSNTYGSGMALIDALNGDWKKTTEWYWAYLYGLSRLAGLSGNNQPYDIKATLLQPNQGYIYGFDANDGLPIFTTGRALGNILFGTNLSTVANLAWNATKQDVWDIAFTRIGPYNERNGAKMKDRFYNGEHPYSGSYIYLGYWGWGNKRSSY